jgi:subtilase family serine protease
VVPVNGYGPADLQSAYALPSLIQGHGQVVAIVDAYDDPSAESDLAVYRSAFGLSPCTTASGCFRKVDEYGGTNLPHPDYHWAGEISLDLDMVSAVCPNCGILLVEGFSSSFFDLGNAVSTAARLGANAISNSYGAPEVQRDLDYDAYYDHPGISVTVATGDKGFGVYYPASPPFVTAVGGTTLLPASNSRGWSETAWSGTSGGCSAYEAKPSWQTDSGCSMRTAGDVAAIADPTTGVAVYDTYKLPGWLVFGGTSVASPIIASVYALAGNESSLTGASRAYSNASSLNDIVSGSTGKCGTYLCNAGPGYDGPTGNGTPEATTAF